MEKKDNMVYIDIDKMLEPLYKEGEQEKYDTLDEQSLFKSDEELAKIYGITVEELQKMRDAWWNSYQEKLQEFLKTGNPISIIIDNQGRVVGEVYRKRHK